MKIIVEVEHATGSVMSGVSKKTGKPFVMATQDCNVFEVGKKYPVQGKAPIKVPDNNGIQSGEPQWFKPGRYETDLIIGTSRFGEFETRIDWRNMRPVVADAKRVA